MSTTTPNKNVVLISPGLILQDNDKMTTGIVYMPVGLAYFGGQLRGAGWNCAVIDAFGEDPNQWWREEGFIFRGLTPVQVCEKVEKPPSAFVLYAMNLTYHRSLIQILEMLARAFPDVPRVIMENTQAVTSYSLRNLKEELIEAGADFLLTGESEERGLELLEAIAAGKNPEKIAGIDGIGFAREGRIHYTPPVRKIEDLDGLALPAWDLFPLKNYWSLKYGHGPFTTAKYLPVLTSRGCPYPCRFCVIPELNDLKWRARSARGVVDELEFLVKEFGVREFHIEDVDPTVSDARTREICREILDRGLKITWKLCAGTKVETLKNVETIELMARAGCRYISISPESGSPRVLKLIKKPFKLDHAVRLVKKMNAVGIASQACFVLGFPGEEETDREMTLSMVRDLTRVGVDEIAVFIITPVPGSAIYNELQGYSDYSQLNFSPVWRSDYEVLSDFRLRLYRAFLLGKLLRHPFKIFIQPFRFLFRRFRTKMEMVPYRALHTAMLTRGLGGRGTRYRHAEELQAGPSPAGRPYAGSKL